jgi:hypothetical protein
VNQLFIIDNDIWRTLSMEEMAATVIALKELDLYRLPYAKVDLEFDIDEYLNMLQRVAPFYSLSFVNNTEPIPDGIVARLIDLTINGPPPTMKLYSYINGYQGDPPWRFLSADVMPKMQSTMCDVLISLLAVRNIKKTATIDKLAHLGIGRAKKHRYLYSTTLSLPPLESLADDEDHPPAAGQQRCPHLRRGHIRKQRFGPKSQRIKRIWIAPVFVHADEQYVNKQRAAYNVSVTKAADSPRKVGPEVGPESEKAT